MQAIQPEGAKNANSPQFKHMGGRGWADSRKSSLVSIRLLPDYTGISDTQIAANFLNQNTNPVVFGMTSFQSLDFEVSGL